MLTALITSPSHAITVPSSLSCPTTEHTEYWKSSWNFGQQDTATASYRFSAMKAR